MFPTHVGMNRVTFYAARIISSMFPTHVGMNRPDDKDIRSQRRMFPTHVGMNHGGRMMLRLCSACSPHTWG